MSSSEDIDVMKWVSRAALEYIGQAGLGYSFDALDDTKSNSYSEVMKMLGCVINFLQMPNSCRFRLFAPGLPCSMSF